MLTFLFVNSLENVQHLSFYFGSLFYLKSKVLDLVLYKISGITHEGRDQSLQQITDLYSQVRIFSPITESERVKAGMTSDTERAYWLAGLVD